MFLYVYTMHIFVSVENNLRRGRKLDLFNLVSITSKNISRNSYVVNILRDRISALTFFVIELIIMSTRHILDHTPAV